MIVKSEMRTTGGESEMILDEMERRPAMRRHITGSVRWSASVEVGDVGRVGGQS